MMEKSEWRRWGPAIGLAAIAASVGSAITGYWVLAVIGALVAGAVVGALAIMLAVDARDLQSLRETPKKLAAAVTEAIAKAWRIEIDTLRGDFKSLRAEVKTWRGDVREWRDEVRGWHDEVRGWHRDVKTWRGEILDLVVNARSEAAVGTAAAASGAITAAWNARPAPARVKGALPLVLIAQIQRSGGSLLSQQFDGHPQIMAFPHELKWGGAIKYRWPHVDPRTEGSLRIARHLVAENLKNNDLFNLLGYHKPAMALEELDLDQHLPFQWSQWLYVTAFLEGWKEHQPQTRRQCFDVFMSSYFSAFFDWRMGSEPKKFITAFTPRMNFVKTYPENISFFEDYPDGLLVSICRHPSDWFASARIHQPQYEDVKEAMALWRESTECAIQLKEQYPDNVYLVQFASLVTDPEGAMRRLTDRLGLAWDPILLVPTFNGLPIASNSSFSPSTRIDALALERRERLEVPLREQIEAENLPLYQRFVDLADV